VGAEDRYRKTIAASETHAFANKNIFLAKIYHTQAQETKDVRKVLNYNETFNKIKLGYLHH
jgi:hypothetical protein